MLDEEEPTWREDTVILLDGARYHTGEEVREYLQKMQLRVVWSAPYSYSAAPIELLFGGLKFGELNPEKLPTGKRVSTISHFSYLLGFTPCRRSCRIEVG